MAFCHLPHWHGEGRGSRCWVPVGGGSVGGPEMEMIPLDDVHALMVKQGSRLHGLEALSPLEG